MCNGILSIDDELIAYTGKTATQFTGCQRGAFGTVAAQHTAGATVRANMVSAYIKALQPRLISFRTGIPKPAPSPCHCTLRPNPTWGQP